MLQRSGEDSARRFPEGATFRGCRFDDRPPAGQARNKRPVSQ